MFFNDAATTEIYTLSLHDAIPIWGKALFPYLVDPNTGVEMYESSDIVRYLFSEYGDGNVPLMLGMGPLTDLSSIVSGLSRGAAGSRVTPSREPSEPLELASFEASPFSRLVRETLCSLEIPYLLRNVAKGSPSREAFEIGRAHV